MVWHVGWYGGGQEDEVEVKSAGKRDRGPDHDLTNTRLGNSVYSGIGLISIRSTDILFFHDFNSVMQAYFPFVIMQMTG